MLRSNNNNHVFVIRHCVRSTKDDIDLFDGKGRQPLGAVPQWNTPHGWCTEQGIKHIKTTGKLLLKELYDKHDNRNIHLQVISDTKQRDVDTAAALVDGMQTACSKKKHCELSNWSDLQYMPSLFTPLLQENMDNPQDAVCSAGFSLQELFEEAEFRQERIPPPPLLSTDVLQQLQLLFPFKASKDDVGINETTLLLEKDFGMHQGVILSDSETPYKLRLQGIINWVKRVAQEVFYSRASGVFFLPSVFRNDTYAMLKYAYWVRSVLSVGNSFVASHGAFLAAKVWHALQQKQDTTSSLTIIAGHDGDLDALATALGMNWKLPAPYNTQAEWYATPPGSGLYFSNNGGASEETRVSYLYPVFDWTSTNVSVALHRVPVQCAIDQQKTTNVPCTVQRVDETTSTIVDFPSRLVSILSNYPGSMDCHQRGVELFKTKKICEDGSPGEVFTVAAAAAVFGTVLLVLGLVVMLSRIRRKKNSEYGVVNGGSIDSTIEMS